MRLAVRWMCLVAALLVHAQTHAQIYACTAEDGTRIFSDERCGADAKPVSGITTKKRAPANSAATAKAARKPRTAAELEELIQLCDAGDTKACTEWTLGGGPNLLREKERQAEVACEAGSLAACEERYCADGIDDDCRARVLRTAELAGETWYLREQGSWQQDGLTKYNIRCIPPGVRDSRDVTIVCSREAGPNRCYLSNAQQGFARLHDAALEHCSR